MPSGPKAQTVSKLYAARRQLVTAIHLFFDDREPVSVHTLAHAAWTVITDLLKHDKKKTYLEGHAAKRDLNLKEVRKRARTHRNFLTHADDDPETHIEDFRDDFNDDVLAATTIDLFTLCDGKIPIEAWVLMLWFVAMYPKSLPDSDDETARWWRDEAAGEFPKIQSSERLVQKRMGKAILERTLSNEKILKHYKTDRSQIRYWT